MEKRLKKPFMLLFTAVAVLVAASVFFLQSFLSTEVVKAAFQRELSDFTGQQIVLNGDVEIRLFPAPEARLTYVIVPSKTIGNKPFLEIETVKARMGLLTLLTGKAQFSSLQLERPRLNLMRSADGSVDWQEGFGQIANAADSARDILSKIENTGDNNAPKVNELLPAQFERRLGNVVFDGGSVILNDADGKLILEATSLKGNILWPSLNAPISLNGSGVVKGVPISYTFNAAEPLSFLAGQTTPTDLNLISDIATLSYQRHLGFFRKHVCRW
ncbi:MAG: AsmA family protein [Ahrensia sp.]|nr:AsmA family protein [Ahrensia sp.]